MTTKFILNRDINGYPSRGLDFPTYNYTSTLTTGGGAASVTAVSGKAKYWIARIGIKEGSIVWVAKNTTATVPAGATFASSASVLVSEANCEFLVEDGDVLSLISPDAAAPVSVSFYEIGNQL